jgi:hypothetical protein
MRAWSNIIVLAASGGDIDRKRRIFGSAIADEYDQYRRKGRHQVVNEGEL